MSQSTARPGGATPAVSISGVRIEYLGDALGIGVDRPRLSWIVETTARNWHQAAYEVEIDRAGIEPLESPVRVESNDSILVPWPFGPLTSRERVRVRVRVRGNDGVASEWSGFRPIEVGLLEPTDWSARFVTPVWDEEASEPRTAPLLRREFRVDQAVERARLYVTALGVYEPQINGIVVGGHVLAPGWTSYSNRLRYQTFDVTDLLQTGKNVLGAMVGDGWYRGRLGWGGGQRDRYGDRLALLAQLEI